MTGLGAVAGGVAGWLVGRILGRSVMTAPGPLRGLRLKAVERGEDIAHLFDQDETRLRATARRLGVKIIQVCRPGSPSQHIDLCGQPCRRAQAEAAATLF